MSSAPHRRQYMEQKINEKDFYGINYYEYGKPFLGSYKGMRYKLARNPLENVFFKSPEEKANGTLLAVVWPEPFSFDVTPDDKKVSCEFPFSDEGRRAAVDWINEQYETRQDEWRQRV
jgi:hypothetical protein